MNELKKNISVDEIKKYLKNLMELETEKYRLEEIKDKLYMFNSIELSTISNNNFKFYNKKIKSINEIKENEIKQIKAKIEHIKKSKLEGLLPPKKPSLKPIGSNYWPIAMVLGASFSGSCFNIVFDKDSTVSDIILSVFMGIFSIFVLVMGIKKYNEKEKLKIKK